MPRSKLEQRDAKDIARKIGATVDPQGKHQRATLEYNGRIVLTFGIRHGSKTGQGHLVGKNHELKLSATKAIALARCDMTKDEYIEHLRERNIIAD